MTRIRAPADVYTLRQSGKKVTEKRAKWIRSSIAARDKRRYLDGDPVKDFSTVDGMMEARDWRKRIKLVVALVLFGSMLGLLPSMFFG